MSTPIAAGRTIWATKSAIARRACGCSHGGRRAGWNVPGPRHAPVFVALEETVRRHQIPRRPFADLILAFVQDQNVTRYAGWDELFDYCRCSANPVGRLVLYLCGYSDPERQRLADSTCTALQLANFWQDVTVDLLKNRIYIPFDVLERHGCLLDDLFARRFTPGFREAMRESVAKAANCSSRAFL